MRFRGFLTAVALVAACGDDGPPPTTDPYEHVVVPVHCWNSIAGQSLYPLGPNPSDLLMNFHPSPTVSIANAAVVSHDGGRTWAKLFGEVFIAPQIPRAEQALVSVQDPVYIGDDFYVAARGNSVCVGVPELPLVVVLDGTGHETCPIRSSAALAAGVNAEFVFKADGQRWLARSGGLLYASRDAGASWKLAGGAPISNLGGLYYTPIAFDRDRVLLRTAQQPGVKLQIAGQPAVDLQFGQTESATFWGDSIVFGNFGSALTTPDLGVTTTPLGVAADDLPLGFHTDRQGRLWALPLFYHCIRDRMLCSDSGYRWDPGVTTPVKIDLDFGGLPVDGVATYFDSAPGQFRMLVRADGSQPEALRSVICDAGDGVTAGWEPLETQPIVAASSSAGIVRVERFDAGTEQTGRMAIAPSGRIYAIAGDQARLTAGPPSWPFLYGYTQENPPSPGRQAAAPFAAAETTVDLALDTVDTSASPFPPHLLGHYSSQEEAKRLGEETFALDGKIFQVREYPGAQLVQTDHGTWRRDHVTSPANQLRAPTWEDELVVDNAHGAWVGGLKHWAQGTDFTTEYIVRFDPARQPALEKYVAIKPCYEQTPVPAYCIPMVNLIPTDAEFDADGNLYILDANHGSVYELAAGSNTVVSVATGFMRPNDLAIRYVDGKPIVLVLDGDVWAFAPALGTTKKLAPSPAPTHTAMFGSRDVRGCLRNNTGPCLVTPAANSGTLDLTTGAGCVDGANLGTSGTVIAGGVAATVSSWTEARVCFTLPANARSGLVHVIAGGIASNRIGYVAKATVTGWPATPVIAGRVVRITGTNLESVDVTGGTQHEIARGDTFVDIEMTEDGPVRIDQLGRNLAMQTLTVKPDVVQSCTVAPGQICHLVGHGLLAGGATITVDGAPVTPFASSENELVFYAPAGLTVGAHTIAVGAAVATLTVPALAPEALATHLIAGAMTFGPPALTTAPDNSPHVVITAYVPSYSLVSGAETPTGTVQGTFGSGWERRDGMIPAFDPAVFGGSPAGAVRLANIGTDAIQIAGSTIRRIASTGQRLPSSPITQTLLATLSTPANSSPLGAGLFAGRIVAVESDGTNTTLYDLPVTGSASPVAVGATIAFSGFGGRPIIAPTGVYLSTCGVLNTGAKVVFVPLSGAGPLAFGAPQTIIDQPTARILACAPTSDGYALVIRDGGGVERVFRHTVAGGIVLFAALPAGIPTGDVRPMVPAVRDLAEAPSGDAVLLVDDRSAGLRLYRLTSAGAATSSAALSASTISRPGELCIHPISPAVCGPSGALYAGDGCAPTSCPMRPWQLVARSFDVFATAYLVPGTVGVTAEVVYEANTVIQSSVHLGGGADIHRVTMIVP